MAKEMRSPIESGCPDAFQYMHPVMRKNYGQWAYHEDPQPGVLLHVSNNGDKIWTVRAGPSVSSTFSPCASFATLVTNTAKAISTSLSAATSNTRLLMKPRYSH
jgi:hypothetical protein